MPYATSRGVGMKQTQTGEVLTLTGNFSSLFDGTGKNLAPQGAKTLQLSAKTGKLIGFE